MTELWETYYDPIASGQKGDTGAAGSDGTAADVGAWHSGHAFAQGDRCYHAKTGYGQCVYRCKTGQAHTSEAANEPEVGGSWTDKWELFAGGGANGTAAADVYGPASSVTGNIAKFADTSGKLLADAGTPKVVVDTVLSAETASTTATDGDVDSIVVKEAGGWKLKTLDNVFTRWVPFSIPAGAFITSGTTPCGTPTAIELSSNKHNYRACSFGYTTKSYGWANFSLPVGYTGGTIKAYINWYSDGVTSDGVRFGIQGNSIGDNESLDPAWGTVVEVTDNATGTANRRLKTGVMDAITLGGTPQGGQECSLRFYRDPTHGDDNLGALIYVTGISLLIPINKESEV